MMVMRYPSKIETKKEAISRLLMKEEELFVVTNVIVAGGNVGTQLWNIYRSIDDAMRWIELVLNKYEISYGFTADMRAELMRTGNVKLNFTHTVRGINEDVDIEETFIIERITK